MARGKSYKVSFKPTFQNQVMLFPPDLNEMVSADHPVRIVDQIIDGIDLRVLVARYKAGGTSSYSPSMLLKVLVYAYMNNIYSSRKIEDVLKRDIYFMWLSGMSKPDHNTISRFRSNRLQEILQPIFSQVVLLLCTEGLLSLKELYTDGTKIEANANRYSFVWGKSITNNREKIKEQLNELWKYAQSVAAAELNSPPDPPDPGPVDSSKVREAIEQINQALDSVKNEKKVDPKIRQKLNYARKNWPDTLDKYDKQEQILNGRKSYSKTDTDATFMRMKEDHMKNGQLKPAYNVQISTNNQYILSYSIHQNPGDTLTLPTHLSSHIKHLKIKPSNITADAGYGSEQNYKLLESKKITAYVKHNQFDRNQNEKIRLKKRFTVDQLPYDQQEDVFTCPAGKKLINQGSSQSQSSSGYPQVITKYQCESCSYCRLKNQCHGQKGNRVIEVNLQYRRLKTKADKRLNTKKGIAKRKKRSYEVEPVFANIKHNHQFKRFMLRGLEKVTVEMGLLALAHNLRKVA
ncbi:transposase, IS4 family [Chitinophaga jiangningensis]|uniref:Transposase, IS4 family n=1 Tax=Chitinophaga jiangningensis TaxID=1419482 RepID=A0A1M7N5H9_9BACT|nr:IS1182 family transposase [Chitinophaga jiangningensis]SHM98829.1 transposase, IS4 family [Chitinophaga jiangningensis]